MFFSAYAGVPFFDCIQRMLRYRLHKPAMLDALESNQPVGKLIDLGGLAVHDQYLQAGIVVQVSMTC